MPKLTEIVEMFARFGFGEEYVRQTLAQGDSAFNAFEGLKLTLQLRWGELCQELSVDCQRELRSVYDRLQGITMKARVTGADLDREERAQTARAARKIRARVNDWRRGNVENILGKTRNILRQQKREGKLDAAGETRAKVTGLFGEDETI